MKTELLHQIEAQRKRRRNRFFALIFFTLMSGIGVFALLFTKLFFVESHPVMAPNETTQLKLISGSGVTFGNRFLLISENAILEFSYRGHQTEKAALSKNDKLDHLQVELQPAIKHLSITTIPSVDVTWLIDDQFAAESGSMKVSLSPNTPHKIVAMNPFGGSVTKNVQINWSDEPPAELLFDVSEWAVSIDSTPSSAEVFVAGHKIGTTPLDFLPEPSKTTIEISKPGFQSETINFSSDNRGNNKLINVTLKPVGKSIPIYLKPRGGKLTGGSITDDSSNMIPTLPLPREVTYFKKGFVAQTAVVTEETNSLSFDLKPAAGKLAVISPVGGEVLIPGLGSRKIPMAAPLPVGELSVTVSADGFQSQKIKISIFQDETTKISPLLETIDSYRARTAPPRETAPHGISLVKIVGAPIRLGAERNVIGQRANEILRDVDFNRQFYFSDSEISEEQFSNYSGKQSSSKQPITGVSWEEAAKFCNYLSEKQGLQSFYKVMNGRVVGWDTSSIGYRLPTEAEWEYVASKHTKRKKTLFTWGDKYEVPDSGFGNIADKESEGKAKKFIADRSDGYAELAPVGFSRQVGTISDLSGNVSEWVHDYYSVAAPIHQPVVDYLGPSKGRQHFVKGSNYLSSSWTELRASYREPIDESRSDVGFRVARYVF